MKNRSEFKKNISFSFSNMWKWDRWYILLDVIIRAWDLVESFFAVALLSLIISLLVNRNKFVFICLIVFFVFQTVLDLLVNCVSRSKELRHMSLYMKYQRMLYKKSFHTDYSNLENPAYTDNYCIALQNTVGGCSPVNFASDLFEIVFAVLGVILFGGITSILSFWLLFPVAFYSVSSLICTIKLNQWSENTRKENIRYDRREGYYSSIYEDLGFAKDARIFNLKWFILPELEAVHLIQIRNQGKFETRKLWISIFLIVLSLLQQAMTYCFVIRALIAGTLSAGEFTLCITSIATLGSSVMQIINGFARLNADSIKVSAYRMYMEMEDEHDMSIVTPEGVISDSLSIEFKNVSFRYPNAENDTLSHISFSIKPGEKVALVGINGAGKTTLVKLLCGLYTPTEGDILLNGVTSDKILITDWYGLFSPVFQDNSLLPISVKEFIVSDFSSDSPSSFDEEKFRRAVSLSGMDEVIKSLKFGVDTVLMKGIYDEGVDLSGGETQKLLIARAIYKDAPIIVLDEPTAAMDPISEKKLYENYQMIFKEKIVLFISHRMSSVHNCDKILVLNNGEIEDFGTHDELMSKNGTYASLFNAQKQFYV